ncbi:ARF GTPase-activating protein GIT1 isoform X2 [Schistocerca gregaria]|uniref:ARF GTPase-activating protein GIT1 isoform X2 n=1 Tax=Schistocerca gregaria TaxID=7010 RepID=UPI00211E558C|nr:ARF GTPase-activating protein GIT1 isoform X2 [Schistocerca gregaria]
MSKGKLRTITDVCADCGSQDPAWASVNRCVVLCDDCCSVHRSLGRHVSQIKSLRRSVWSASQLLLLQSLNSHAVNSVWEHALLEPGRLASHRKPHPRDPLHPKKTDFIRAKYLHLAFVFRPGKDEPPLQEDDLSQQLHSSVRTANLETSLRLLSQGADPCYFHQEKGTTPLHVAAKEGQTCQGELLIAWGADPMAPDAHEQTPVDYARAAGHRDLAERLVECAYELTDRLAYYLCSRRPDHVAGQHYIIPEMADPLELSELSKVARKKLQQLPNHVFEELAMDVYDEVDRREIDMKAVGGNKYQHRQHPMEASKSSVMSSSRHPILSAIAGTKHRSEVSDDEPLYDSVASDEDYVGTDQLKLLPQQAQSVNESQKPQEKMQEEKSSSENVDSPVSEISKDQSPSTSEENSTASTIEHSLRLQLATSEARMDELRLQLNILQSTVSSLLAENQELRQLLQSAGLNIPTVASPQPNGYEPVQDMRGRSTIQRPASMYETREGIRSAVSIINKKDSSGDYDCPSGPVRPAVTQSLYSSSTVGGVMPVSEEVIRRTDQVTKRIQELVVSMQGSAGCDAFVPCAERIRVAVAELTAIFPQNPLDEHIRIPLRQLNGNTARLQTICANLQRCTGETDRSYYLQQVRSCAYDIAKATKQLVTYTPQ